jgi:hypothetical protein
LPTVLNNATLNETLLTRTLTHTLTCTLTRMLTRISPAQVCPHASPHAHPHITHTLTHMLTCTLIRTITYTLTHTFTSTHVPAHVWFQVALSLSFISYEFFVIPLVLLGKLRHVQGGPSKFEQLRLNITFFVIARFSKINFKITARALPVIPPKFTGVPVTQSDKIILM